MKQEPYFSLFMTRPTTPHWRPIWWTNLSMTRPSGLPVTLYFFKCQPPLTALSPKTPEFIPQTASICTGWYGMISCLGILWYPISLHAIAMLPIYIYLQGSWEEFHLLWNWAVCRGQQSRRSVIKSHPRNSHKGCGLWKEHWTRNRFTTLHERGIWSLFEKQGTKDEKKRSANWSVWNRACHKILWPSSPMDQGQTWKSCNQSNDFFKTFLLHILLLIRKLPF